MTVDTQKYLDFVDGVTSEPSKDFAQLLKRVTELEVEDDCDLPSSNVVSSNPSTPLCASYFLGAEFIIESSSNLFSIGEFPKPENPFILNGVFIIYLFPP